MSIGLNHLVISGNLTRDVETRDVGERSVAHFTIANNRRWRGSDGSPREDVIFLDCEAWGRTGEIAAEFLAKGRPVLVEGRLKQDAWTDAQGQKHSRIKLSIERLHLVASRTAPAGDGESEDDGEERATRPVNVPASAAPLAQAMPTRPPRRAAPPVHATSTAQRDLDAPF